MASRFIVYVKIHRFISAISIIAFLCFLSLFLSYAYTIYILKNDVSKMNYKYAQVFDGLEELPGRGIIFRDHLGCDNTAEFGVDIECGSQHSYKFEPKGSPQINEQRIRNLFDKLISDGWTGGTELISDGLHSSSSAFYVVPANRSSELQPTYGSLDIKMEKSL